MPIQLTKGTVCLCAITALLAASGCSFTDEREIREAAYSALKADGALPAGATLAPISACVVYNAKNAATVEAPVAMTDVEGRRTTHRYAVWIKRLGTRWVVEGFAAMPVSVRPLSPATNTAAPQP